MSEKYTGLWPTPNKLDGMKPRDNKKLRKWNNERDGRKNRQVLSNLREAIHDEYYTNPAPPASHQLTLFAADSPVSLSLQPGSDAARKTTVTSGLSFAALLRRSDPVGLWLKMCLESSSYISTRCYLTWRGSATPQGRSLYRLLPSMPRTDETGYGLWPTPRSQEDGSTPKQHMARQARSDAKSSTGGPHHKPTSLAVMAKLWPTPASDTGNGGPHGLAGGSGNMKKLRSLVGEKVGKQMGSGALNPQWVEWLMGFPGGWTDLER